VSIPIDLSGSAVVVTGAGRHRGLGQGIARAFVTAGADVLLSDIGQVGGSQFPEHGVATRDELDQVAGELRELGGGRVETAVCDVRDEAQVAALAERAVECFGSLDVWVNNAGIGYLMAPVQEVQEADWDAVLDVNLKGTFLGTKHAAQRMIARGTSGRIINISSQGGKSGFPHASAYVSSKHAIVGLTRAAAIDLGPFGITVNAVCPNHVTTGLGAWQNTYFSALLGQSEEDYLASMRARIPLARNGTPEDIAHACVFLASPLASYISGEAMNVSGGEETH
jgi:meso-butanediol dehydrogenase/(S,S)-butanediol dehydrogenase/diacetyl reductase